MGRRSYGSGRLFARADSGGRETWYGSWWAGEVRVKRRIGPKRRPGTFHELRHTFGTQMAAAGAPLRAIQEWMGHADASTTEIYSHYAPDPTGGAAFAERAFRVPGPEAQEPAALPSL